MNITNNPPPVVLIQVGAPPELLKDKHGDLPDWFSRAMGLASDAIQVVKVFMGEILPEPDASRVAVITGSWQMVTDKLPWSEQTAEWIRRAVQVEMPLFGVCYGHQLMAHALGGAVDYHPQGREMGCLDVKLTRAGGDDPLTGQLPRGFRAHLTHLQTVTKLPTGAQTLASSAHDANQIIRYNAKAVSTQFHPEFTPDIAASLIGIRAEALLSEGYDLEQMCAALTDAASARELLKAFIHSVLAGSYLQTA